jgi:hypothetical protein
MSTGGKIRPCPQYCKMNSLLYNLWDSRWFSPIEQSAYSCHPIQLSRRDFNWNQMESIRLTPGQAVSRRKIRAGASTAKKCGQIKVWSWEAGGNCPVTVWSSLAARRPFSNHYKRREPKIFGSVYTRYRLRAFKYRVFLAVLQIMGRSKKLLR